MSGRTSERTGCNSQRLGERRRDGSHTPYHARKKAEYKKKGNPKKEVTNADSPAQTLAALNRDVGQPALRVQPAVLVTEAAGAARRAQDVRLHQVARRQAIRRQAQAAFSDPQCPPFWGGGHPPTWRGWG